MISGALLVLRPELNPSEERKLLGKFFLIMQGPTLCHGRRPAAPLLLYEDESPIVRLRPVDHTIVAGVLSLAYLFDQTGRMVCFAWRCPQPSPKEGHPLPATVVPSSVADQNHKRGQWRPTGGSLRRTCNLANAQVWHGTTLGRSLCTMRPCFESKLVRHHNPSISYTLPVTTTTHRDYHRHVLVTRNWMDAIVSGYLYRRAGYECSYD